LSVPCLRRESFAALISAAVQNRFTGFARHTLHETVFTGAAAGLGLVCSLWHIGPYYSIFIGNLLTVGNAIVDQTV
jgi:hypothetical protein